MEFFENIKRKVGFYLLGKEDLPKRTPKVANLETAKTIGILYDATTVENYNAVKDFVKILKDQKKQVKTLGYVGLDIPKDFQQAKLDFDFFLKKDLNWYNMPGHHLVDNFCNDQFDILIDFTLTPLLPQLFVLTWSKAKCKVGRQDEQFAYLFDIMIDINKKPELKYLIQQVRHYLTLINQTHNA